eukprot:376878-Pelagomonas_calceolata.AAC.4
MGLNKICSRGTFKEQFCGHRGKGHDVFADPTSFDGSQLFQALRGWSTEPPRHFFPHAPSINAAFDWQLYSGS